MGIQNVTFPKQNSWYPHPASILIMALLCSEPSSGSHIVQQLTASFKAPLFSLTTFPPTVPPATFSWSSRSSYHTGPLSLLSPLCGAPPVCASCFSPSLFFFLVLFANWNYSVCFSISVCLACAAVDVCPPQGQGLCPLFAAISVPAREPCT